jgi:hypothetical protein
MRAPPLTNLCAALTFLLSVTPHLICPFFSAPDLQGAAYYNNYPGSVELSSFWRWAEQMEMIADAYDRSRNDQYKEQIVLLYQGFIVQYTTDWRSSPYNDDIMCVRV